MAHEQRERPFILQWRSAVLNSQQSSTVKLCLLTMAEWADADGSNCRPSIPSIASRASVNEKTVRRSMDKAEAAGFIKRSTFSTTKGWRCFVYLPTVPNGADIGPVRSSDGVDPLSAGPDASCGLSVRMVRTLCPDGVGKESTDLGHTYPLLRQEQTRTAPRPVDPVTLGTRFAEFYCAYPRAEARPSAEKAWKRLALDKQFDAILADVTASNAPGGRWYKTDRRFIPLPATYLNGRRWEDGWKGSTSSGSIARDTRSEDELVAALEADARRMGVNA